MSPRVSIQVFWVVIFKRSSGIALHEDPTLEHHPKHSEILGIFQVQIGSKILLPDPQRFYQVLRVLHANIAFYFFFQSLHDVNYHTICSCNTELTLLVIQSNLHH